jgi:hypothetical protein
MCIRQRHCPARSRASIIAPIGRPGRGVAVGPVRNLVTAVDWNMERGSAFHIPSWDRRPRALLGSSALMPSTKGRRAMTLGLHQNRQLRRARRRLIEALRRRSEQNAGSREPAKASITAIAHPVAHISGRKSA